MDTTVTIKAAGDLGGRAIERALHWFREVEARCSRFDRASELYRLCQTTRADVQVSRLLFEAVRLALEVAEASGGVFDPTVGGTLALKGFDRNYATGRRIVPPSSPPGGATYRDVTLDEAKQTIRLEQPVMLDLGAVAKGLAIDLAAMELAHLDAFSIDAGGDILVKGLNESGEPWRIGIAHPRQEGALVAALHLTEGAVCTSGDYERRQPDGLGHHIIDPTKAESAASVISATVVARRATVADALSTAAFVAGPQHGLALLAAQQVDGMLVTHDLEIVKTAGFDRWAI